MMKTLLLVAGLGAAGLLVWGFYTRSRFIAYLDNLESDVQASESLSKAREDLPPQVLALAVRLGARTDSKDNSVAIQQVGDMWSAPGRKPMGFTARQSIALSAPDFVWRARFEPSGYMTVVDYHAGERAGLEVRLAGVIPMVNNVGTEAVSRGEVMRYLAELAWAPDAILMNREIDWHVVDAKTFVVGNGKGPWRAEVTLHLGPDGLIERMDTAARPAQEGKVIVDRPWGGRFWDYQVRGGRTIPMQGEVYWVRDGKRFIYWRGRLTNWTVHDY